MARGDGTSGYLQIGKRYFPSNAPTWYSYTLNFAAGGRRNNLGMIHVAGTAWKKLSGERINGALSGWENPKVLQDLQVLIDMARNSELAFLDKYGLGTPGNDWSELIRSFNMLFSDEQALRMQLDLIKRSTQPHAKDKDVTYHYFATYFGSYVQTAAREIVANKISAQMPIKNFDLILDEIIELALNKLFGQKVYKDKNGVLHTTDTSKQDKEEMEMTQAYTGFVQHIQKFLANPIFKQSIADTLGIDMKFLKETERIQKHKLKHPRSKKAQPTVTDSFSNGNIKGTIAEAFETVIGEAATEKLVGQIGNEELSLNWHTEWSGGSGVKADVILHNLTFGKNINNISGLTTQSGEDDSNRVNAIENYERWFREMQQAKGEIVFISDKNYQINSKFGGFTAQSKVTLANLQALFEKVHVEYTEGLIDFLSNCGSDMLLGNRYKEVMDAVATQIGHFLFDDLTIEGSHSINRIHLLNLSGIYMPLSVYLEGIQKAIQGTIMSGSTKDFVSVSFSARPSASTAAAPWTDEQDWKDFRDARLNQSYVDVHFMRNFAQFMISQVKI